MVDGELLPGAVSLPAWGCLLPRREAEGEPPWGGGRREAGGELERTKGSGTDRRLEAQQSARRGRAAASPIKPSPSKGSVWRGTRPVATVFPPPHWRGGYSAGEGGASLHNLVM